MHLHENPDSGLTTSQDDPYLMMNYEKRVRMREALKEMLRYWDAHPTAPSATLRPQLSVRSGVWIVLLGPSISEGIAGFGYTVEAALRAFDTRYEVLSHSAATKPSFASSTKVGPLIRSEDVPPTHTAARSLL